jgi:hypothetical protein
VIDQYPEKLQSLYRFQKQQDSNLGVVASNLSLNQDGFRIRVFVKDQKTIDGLPSEFEGIPLLAHVMKAGNPPSQP